jgi:prepilin-type N-terminal cleavage/methylation domain-containing protein/prepilin-type processing-associated H-X9-DG protein
MQSNPSQPPARRARRAVSRAFTLIELLVVMALIVTMAALLFPALNSVQERSRRAKCQSNCRQIALAGVQLFEDLRGKLPSPATSGERAEELLPYLRSIKEIFDCPTTRGTAAAELRMPSYAYYTDYELNSNLNSSAKAPNQTVIRDASLVAFVFDYPNVTAPNNLAHKKGINCGYLDGHVSWLDKTNLLTSTFKTNGLNLLP